MRTCVRVCARTCVQLCVCEYESFVGGLSNTGIGCVHVYILHAYIEFAAVAG